MLIFRRPKSVLRAVFEASGFASEDSSLWESYPFWATLKYALSEWQNSRKSETDPFL